MRQLLRDPLQNRTNLFVPLINNSESNVGFLKFNLCSCYPTLI